MTSTVNIPKYHAMKGGYILDEDFTYYSPRYNKTVYLSKGMFSDGATSAPDFPTAGFWVHDRLCLDMKWSDGTPATRWQGSRVLSDILKDEGRWFRSLTWKYATYLPKIWKNIKGWF